MTCGPCDAACVGSEAMPELIAAAYPHLADVVARIPAEDVPRWRAVFLDYELLPPLRIWGDA